MRDVLLGAVAGGALVLLVVALRWGWRRYVRWSDAVERRSRDG